MNSDKKEEVPQREKLDGFSEWGVRMDERISQVEHDLRGQREAIGLLDRRLQVLEKERKERLEEEAKDIKALLGLHEMPKP